MGLGVRSELIKVSVVSVKRQSLVIVLCPHGKKPPEIEQDVCESVTLPWKVKTPTNACESVGCLECRQTGFRGREGIYEVMPFSETLQKFADDKANLPELRRQAYKEGMMSLRLSGAQKVANGTTTIEEILRVTPENR